MGSSHVVFLNIFFYGEVTQKRHWQKNLPVGFNGLCKWGKIWSVFRVVRFVRRSETGSPPYSYLASQNQAYNCNFKISYYYNINNCYSHQHPP